MTTGSRKLHDFCWLNLVTPEAARARTFFGDLFGWQYGDMPGIPGGHLILVEGLPAGALMDLDRAPVAPGTPPHLGVMVKVDNADDAAAKVNALGGHAPHAWDVLENGRMAVCTDPNGATFGVWQPKGKDGFEVDSHAHGAPSWFETLTADVGRAARFYAELFGWEVEEQAMPGRSYTRFKLDGTPVGGAMELTAAMNAVPPHWGVYFAVNDAERSARAGAELGGSLCIPVTDIPGVGRFALLKSPQGVSFYVIEYAR